MKNRAAWLTKKGQIEISSTEMPEPLDHEAVVQVACVGICGSDMHFYETGCYSKGAIPFPHILGHECAGIVTKLGKKVEHLQLGDRVAIEPGVPCGVCSQCRSGRYNLCGEIQFKSVPPYHGVLRDYVAHDASRCFKLPENMSLAEGALIEPFAIGLHAAKKAGAGPGKKAVVLGSGCIGMMTMAACRALGIESIIAVDIFDSRLRRAKELCADAVIHSGVENCAERILDLTEGQGADIVFETAGSPATLRMAPALCRSGGVIMMVGNIFGEVSFDFWEIAHREIDLRGIYRYCGEYPEAIALAAEGKVRLTDIVTDVQDFERVNEAFQRALSDKEHTLKTIVNLKA